MKWVFFEAYVARPSPCSKDEWVSGYWSMKNVRGVEDVSIWPLNCWLIRFSCPRSFSIKNEKCFNKCIDKGFKLDVYISDSDSDNDSGSESGSNSDTDTDTDTDNDDYIATIKDIPLQLLCI